MESDRILIAARKYSEALYWKHQLQMRDKNPWREATCTTFRGGAHQLRGNDWDIVYIVGSADETGIEYQRREEFMKDLDRAGIKPLGESAIETVPG